MTPACASAEDLRRYAQGELLGERDAPLRDHIRGCVTCRKRRQAEETAGSQVG